MPNCGKWAKSVRTGRKISASGESSSESLFNSSQQRNLLNKYQFRYGDSEVHSLQDHIAELTARLPSLKSSFLKRWRRDLIPVFSLRNFDLIQDIGSGGFGRVVLVKSKQTGTICALKILEKRHLVKTGHVNHFKNEMRVLNSVRYRFLVHMSFFFYDNVYVYLGMPYISGGELFGHIRLKGNFDEDLAKFYAAQIVLALEYLHYVGVIYRDLKPENVLLEEDGYIKLTDYGFAKLMSDHNRRTYTFCGTPEYIAPEVIWSQGYSTAVDWWSFGILIYEMVAGYAPFRKSTPMKLFEAITACQYKFPPHFSKDLKHLISHLLVSNPTERFGNLKDGSDDIKTHNWLKNVDWHGILHRTVKPKYKPKALLSETEMSFEKKSVGAFRSSPNNEHTKEFAWLTTGGKL